jgi:hypothetical protein
LSGICKKTWRKKTSCKKDLVQKDTAPLQTDRPRDSAAK